MRNAIIHDYFAIRGGGERLALSLANSIDADLIYGYRTNETYPDEMFPACVRDLRLPRRFQVEGVRAATLALRYSAATRLASKYDKRIYSGQAAIFAAPPSDGTRRNIYYCHTPPRFVYDQRDFFAPSGDSGRRSLTNAALALFKKGYESRLSRMDVVIANSETVRDRLRRYCRTESVIVYPPCDIRSNRWIGQGDYYLSTARLSPLKGVDKIVEAFIAMPSKRLIVASGGTELDRLRTMAKDAPNIEFRGWVEEASLRDLIGNAIATIYVAREEDFGMSPVESMAAGKPVIALAEGGLRETVVDGETGTLLPSNFETADLMEAVAAMSPTRALSMRSACEARAAVFSEDRFAAEMREIIDGR